MLYEVITNVDAHLDQFGDDRHDVAVGVVVHPDLATVHGRHVGDQGKLVKGCHSVSGRARPSHPLRRDGRVVEGGAHDVMLKDTNITNNYIK